MRTLYKMMLLVAMILPVLANAEMRMKNTDPSAAPKPEHTMQNTDPSASPAPEHTMRNTNPNASGSVESEGKKSSGEPTDLQHLGKDYGSK